MAAAIERVLVIKLGPVSDFVLALPAMAQVRAAHPKARITLLTTPPFEGFAKATGYFDFVLVEMNPLAGAGSWISLAGRVRQGKHQRIYDFESSAGTNILYQALRPFPPQWSGTATGASHPHKNGRRAAMHPLERRAEQLKHAGIWFDAPTAPGDAPGPDLSFVLKSQAARASAQSRPYIVLAPGGAEASLRWPPERYAELAALFSAQDYDIVLAGRQEDSAVARVVQRTVSRARDLTGRTDVLQLAILAARAHLIVGSDPDFIQLGVASDVGVITPLPAGIDPSGVIPRGHVTVVTAASLADLSPQSVMQVAPALLPPRA